MKYTNNLLKTDIMNKQLWKWNDIKYFKIVYRESNDEGSEDSCKIYNQKCRKLMLMISNIF